MLASPPGAIAARVPGEIIGHGSRSCVRAFGGDAVIKVPRPSTPDSWILAEARYAEAVRLVGAPVPRLLGVEDVAGRRASVWERIDGPSAWEVVVEQPARGAEIGRLLADVQLALFALVPPVPLPRQRDRLASKVRWSAAHVDASLVRALDVLPVDGDPPRLCHGDLHPSNVILSPAGPFVVDWFDASRGDPVADVARSLLTLSSEDGAAPRHLPGAEPATLTVVADAYLARVRERLDLDLERLERWAAVTAVARLAEGLPRPSLIAAWRRFADAQGAAAADGLAQAGSS